MGGPQKKTFAIEWALIPFESYDYKLKPCFSNRLTKSDITKNDDNAKKSL